TWELPARSVAMPLGVMNCPLAEPLVPHLKRKLQAAATALGQTNGAASSASANTGQRYCSRRRQDGDVVVRRERGVCNLIVSSFAGLVRQSIRMSVDCRGAVERGSHSSGGKKRVVLRNDMPVIQACQ